VIALDGSRVEVLSNGASRLTVLRRLATTADFELAVGEVEDQPLTVHIEPTDLRLAVPILVGDLRYRADYAFDGQGGRHQLERLEIGTFAPSELAASRWGPAGSGEEPRPRSADRRGPGEARGSPVRGIGRVLASAVAAAGGQSFQDEEEEREILAALESRDPRVRAGAAENIEPFGRGVAPLLTLALEDPDPGVRAAATAQLAYGDSYAAVSGLLDALGDPDRAVVLEAIEGIASSGDESLLFALEPLRKSGDKDIRRAAEEAVTSLEF
jgi:hypothetical protein